MEPYRLLFVQGLKLAFEEIQLCSRLEALLLQKKILNSGDSSESHAKKVHYLVHNIVSLCERKNLGLKIYSFFRGVIYFKWTRPIQIQCYPRVLLPILSSLNYCWCLLHMVLLPWRITFSLHKWFSFGTFSCLSTLTPQTSFCAIVIIRIFALEFHCTRRLFQDRKFWKMPKLFNKDIVFEVTCFYRPQRVVLWNLFFFFFSTWSLKSMNLSIRINAFFFLWQWSI